MSIDMNAFKSKKFLAFLIFLIFSVAIVALILAIFSLRSSPQEEAEIVENIEEEILEEDGVGSGSALLENPASTRCKNLGGKVNIEKRGDGGEYGVCEFENGKICEEWALTRGFCPETGITINENDSKEVQYCLITGGEVDEENTFCLLPDGNSCSLKNHYNGTCE